MSIEWCRLWHDMPTDPKFRAVAKRAGRPTAEVLAIFTAMMANASANEDERGTLRNWCHEDMAVALDIEPEDAEAIYAAMQGKLLNGDRLTGWERRQPKREDNSAERVRAMRERKRAETPCNAPVTQCNAPEKEKEEDTEKKEDSYQPARTEQVAASGPEEIHGLNGSTQMIVEAMAGWLNPWAPDLKLAHRTVADAVQLYGDRAVRDGFADLKADYADGKVRAMTAKAFYGFVKHARGRSDQKPTAGQPKFLSASERHMERSKESRALIDKMIAGGVQ